MATLLTTGTWARWPSAKKGALGRAHVIAEVVTGQLPDGKHVPAVLLACARARLLPVHIEPKRPDENLCPRCEALDDMRNGYGDRTDIDQFEPEKVLVPVGASKAGN